MLCCELVKLCHINRSGPVFRDTLYIQAHTSTALQWLLSANAACIVVLHHVVSHAMLYFFATSCTKTSSKNKANTCVDGRTVADVCTQQYEYKTSSSAVAQRRRDASCLSVVSFNSTLHRAQSSVIS